MTATDKFWGFFLVFLAVPAAFIAYFQAIEVAVAISVFVGIAGIRILSRQKRRCHACGHIFNLDVSKFIRLQRKKLDCPRCQTRIRKSS
jgi:uncharacterized paraquat-inducible protein A